MSAGYIAHTGTGAELGSAAPPESLFRKELRRPSEAAGFERLVGITPLMERLFQQMRTMAPHLRVASIEGPAGAGKSLAARALHAAGASPSASFVPARATSFFSDQGQSLLAEAAAGTLFLSHVDELDRSQQSRLAEFLEWLEHLHARGSQYVPGKIFVSSRRPLRRLVTEGLLRPELSHRLSAISFTLPALTERRQDIAPLAARFAEEFSIRHGKPVRGLGPGALPRLQAHTWPGNVRELESVIYAAALGCEGQWIRPIDIPALHASASAPAFQQDGHASPWNSDGMAIEEEANLDRAILRHIKAVLTSVKGNKLRAAQLLGISRSTLYRLLEARSACAKL